MKCRECGAPMAPGREYRVGYCSFTCWHADMVRRRDAIIARRGQGKPKAPRKPAWRAVVTSPGPRAPWRCDHRHRTRKAALRCGDRHANPVDDLVRTERWED